MRVTPQVTTASRFGTRMSTAPVRRWFGDTPRVRVSALCTGAEGIPLAAITYDRATLVYPGATRPSVDALDLSISDGEFLVLVGPSGCGKSTSLRMLAGLEDVSEGRHQPQRDRERASFSPVRVHGSTVTRAICNLFMIRADGRGDIPGSVEDLSRRNAGGQ